MLHSKFRFNTSCRGETGDVLFNTTTIHDLNLWATYGADVKLEQMDYTNMLQHPSTELDGVLNLPGDVLTHEQDSKTVNSHCVGQQDSTCDDLLPSGLGSRRKQRNLERLCQRRAQMTPDELERNRAVDRERKQRRRVKLKEYQATEAERSRRRFARMSPEEKQRYRATEAERSRRRYAMMSPEEKEKYRETEAERSRQRYSMMSPEEKEKIRAREAQRSRRKRATMSPEEKEKFRALAAERTRQRRARLQAEMTAGSDAECDDQLFIDWQNELDQQTAAGHLTSESSYNGMFDVNDSEIKLEQDDTVQQELCSVKVEQLDSDYGNSQPVECDETSDSLRPTRSQSKLSFFLQKIREKRGVHSEPVENNRKKEECEMSASAANSHRNVRLRRAPATSENSRRCRANVTSQRLHGSSADPKQSTAVSDDCSRGGTHSCEQQSCREVGTKLPVPGSSEALVPGSSKALVPAEELLKRSGVKAIDQKLTARMKYYMSLSAEEKARYRATEAERVRQRRAMMSHEEKEKFRAVSAERSRQRRAKLRANKPSVSTAERVRSLEHQRVKALKHYHEKIAAMTPEQLQQYRATQAEQRRQRNLKLLGTLTAEELERREMRSSYVSVTVEQTSTGSVEIMRVKGQRLTVVHDINVASVLAHEGKHVYIRSSQEPKPFRCPYCDKCFDGYMYREAHTRRHPERLALSSTGARGGATEQRQLCFFCKVIFSNMEDFLGHLSDTHSDIGWQLFICGICRRAYDRPFYFKLHQDNCHSDQTAALHLCEQCGASFRLHKSLYSHTMLHSGRQPFQCEQCGKRFAFKSAYRNHMDMHATKAGDDRFKCDICNKVLANSKSLSKHVRAHTGKPQRYTCDQCGKSFANPYYRKIHERTHTGERPFSCVECGRAFFTNTHMVLHALRKHNKLGKQHVCEYCNKSFVLKYDLSRHLKHHTTVVPPDECESESAAVLNSSQ